MEDAVWEVIRPIVPVVGAALLALSVVLSVFVALLDGLRIDRWGLLGRRRGGKKNRSDRNLTGGEQP